MFDGIISAWQSLPQPESASAGDKTAKHTKSAIMRLMSNFMPAFIILVSLCYVCVYHTAQIWLETLLWVKFLFDFWLLPKDYSIF
jgi:hypothetical protein